MAKDNKKKPDKKAAGRYRADREELVHFYREMLRIRRFEEKAGQMYGAGLIGGFCHLYIGQEAVVIGVTAAMGQDDVMITGYRDHGHALASGMDPKAVMAELTGRAGGASAGKGGSMHMFAPDKRFFGGHGIVGVPAPIGTGLAFAAKYRDSDAVSVVYFGDGAANQGQVFESFNMAKLWNLRVLYIIENNQYAMGTSVDRATGAADLYHRGASFHIPGSEVDGMDVLAVKAAADEAIAKVRKSKEPRILEMKTYRYRGHSMSDPAKYRSRDEVQGMRKKRDPIDRLRKELVEDGLSEDEIKRIDKEIKEQIAEAADFAQDSPEPDPSELYTDVLVEAAGGEA